MKSHFLSIYCENMTRFFLQQHSFKFINTRYYFVESNHFKSSIGTSNCMFEGNLGQIAQVNFKKHDEIVRTK